MISEWELTQWLKLWPASMGREFGFLELIQKLGRHRAIYTSSIWETETGNPQSS